MEMDTKRIIKQSLYKLIMEQGVLSSRENVLNAGTEDNFDNKVYVRKFSVDIPVDGTRVRMISLASDDKDFSDVDADFIRIGFKNPNNQWSNLFIDEVPSDILIQISYFFSIPNASTL